MVYAATHLSLALLEQLVHVNLERLPDAFRAFAIELPNDVLVETIKLSPSASDPIACRRYGDIWATTRRSAVLIVPSAVVPPTLDPGGLNTDERNIVLNPRHASAGAWRVVETSFRIDPRLRRTVTG